MWVAKVLRENDVWQRAEACVEEWLGGGGLQGVANKCRQKY